MLFEASFFHSSVSFIGIFCNIFLFFILLIADPGVKEEVNKRAFEKLKKETSEKVAIQPVGGVSVRDDGFEILFIHFFKISSVD